MILCRVKCSLFCEVLIHITSSSRADIVNVPVTCPSMKVTLPLVGLISPLALDVVISQYTVTSVNVPLSLSIVRVASVVEFSNPGSSKMGLQKSLH